MAIIPCCTYWMISVSLSVVGDGKAFGVGDSCTQTIYEPATKKAKFKLKWPQPVFFGDF